MNHILRPFNQGNKWGYKNQKGEVIIAPNFNEASQFNNGIAQVKIDGEIHHIDETGTIIQLQFIQAEELSHEMSVSAFSDPLANPQKELENLPNLPLDLKRFKHREKHGYKNKLGKIVIPAQFSKAYEFSEGLALVKIDLHWGYINLTGKLVINNKFDWAECFSQGISRVKFGNKYGYINLSGKAIIPVKYDYIEKFSENLAAVKVGKKWGYINLSGQLVIFPQFDYAESFSDGIARVKVGRNYKYIDHSGTTVNYYNSNVNIKPLATTNVKLQQQPLTPKEPESKNLDLLHTRRRKRRNTTSS
ncbi:MULTISPECIES: WG repeat-containing protein [unclassified Nodularia (in: cyanobacteria)]|uniref:WG repeat-containing protein n=1 Tax=unclassified Nodularia (in: cyanobacteria) TaxID=2656917 RepID=UPI00187F4A79|nr:MULTISPECIES: WG repeat-containing protein [unclassified Nodularia (in: cyanobacteria)]MBE9201637.1 WG repeat-containing protein [Nodularia sp. LEGE 06071]MCC2691895.1 WG repeat-containing protein [Nodularia sp. LEGE 04288]